MSKYQRDKGARGERQTAKELGESFPHLTVRRGFQARGPEMPDITGVPGLHIEVKTGKLPNPRAALAQARRDKCDDVTYPVAVIRDDRCKPFVVMDWADFRRILEPWLKREGDGI